MDRFPTEDWAAPGDRPGVSVVIPCRNEGRHIEACIRSMLAQQSVPRGFEIIVADGMSDDGTRETLERIARQDSRLRVVDNVDQITPCGMNAGIAAARGDYIAIAGAHNRYAPDYLRQSVAILAETGADNVGGAMICEGHTRVQKAVAAAHHSRFAAGGARWHDPDYEGPADTVFGGCYRRAVFSNIGLFDRELIRNQDDEFNLRLIRAGGTIWQSPRIRSWYSPRATIRSLFQQYFQYGYWKVRVIQKHTIPASVRHVIPAAFVLAAVLLPAAALVWPPLWWLWLALAATYAASSLYAALRSGSRWGWEVFWLMPVVFACYHFGYGTGFLAGIKDSVISRAGPQNFSRDITRPT